MLIKRLQRTVPGSVDFPQDMHPVLQRIYASRNIRSMAELDYSLAGLHPYQELSGIDGSVTLLANAIAEGKRLLIVADFDADGATSCALAMRGLNAMGAGDVHYVVPNRFEFGYGLSPEIVRIAASRSPDVIITVDNGIASIDGVALARSMNIDVVITDHHLPGEHLPAASAIVNPNLPGDNFPSKNLAGVGVMFYILIALRCELRERGWFGRQGIAEPNLATLLDLVALGTVADVVPLDHNNRILVAQGLARIRSGQCCQGIRELLKSANRTLNNITAQDLAFAVAPRLNAAGRLTDMSLGIECLLTDDSALAAGMAAQLDQLNRERREIQAEMQQQALEVLEQIDLDAKQTLPHGVCLYHENWHQGVVGILASRIKDRLKRPVIAFAPDRDGQIKGSARSVPGVHIRDVLDTIANLHPGVIDKFGGHAMAAGLSLEERRLEHFRELFAATVEQFMQGEDLSNHYLSDGELAASEMTFDLASNIRSAGPWGQGFPEPQFDGRFEIVSSRIVADKHLKLQLRTTDQRKTVEAIAFNQLDDNWPAAVRKVEALYRLDINEFAGRRQLQLIVENINPIGSNNT